MIGNSTMTDCQPSDIICNGPLSPGTQYQYKYRLYTTSNDDSFIESDYSMPLETG